MRFFWMFDSCSWALSRQFSSKAMSSANARSFSFISRSIVLSFFVVFDLKVRSGSVLGGGPLWVIYPKSPADILET